MPYLKIGVVGDLEFGDENTARRLLECSINKAVHRFGQKNVQLIPRSRTGSISALTREIAEKRGYSILDVESIDNSMRVNEVMLKAIGLDVVGAAFLNRIHVIIRLGGGEQARHEVTLFEEWGGKAYECDFEILSDST